MKTAILVDGAFYRKRALLQKGIDFRHSETYSWTNSFFDELIRCRKLALRLGELADEFAHFDINAEKLKSLCKGEITISELNESDFTPSFRQKGVAMWATVKDSLFEHIDGLQSQWGNNKRVEDR